MAPTATAIYVTWKTGRSLRREFAERIGGGHSAFHEDVAAGDKAAVRVHDQRGHGCHLIWSVWSASAARSRQLNHAPIVGVARPGEFVASEQRDDDAGADGFEAVERPGFENGTAKSRRRDNCFLT